MDTDRLEDGYLDDTVDFAVRERPADMTEFHVTTTRIGPEHDPYARVQVAVTSGNNKIIYRDCALTGVMMMINGEVLVDENDTGGQTRTEWSDLMESWFEALTGVRVEDVMMWEIDQWADQCDIRMAEIRAGWDPSP